MTSFYTMLFLAVGSTAGLYVYGRLRPVGKPITWGEGILAALGIFAYLALIYVIFLGVNLYGWLWWQKRGRVRAATPELPRSAYGRPLVKKA